MRLLLCGMTAFLLGGFCLCGDAIRGGCRFLWTSAVNLESRRADSPGVGVGSVGGVCTPVVVVAARAVVVVVRALPGVAGEGWVSTPAAR